MRFLMRITVTFVFAVSTVITLVYRLEVPRPVLFSRIFSDPDGTPCTQPCLLGVHPDATYRDVLKRVEQHPFVQGLKRDRHGKEVEYVEKDVSVYVTPDEEESTIGVRTASVTVFFTGAHAEDSQAGTESDTALRLGQVIDVLGVPEVMEIAGDQVYLLYYHRQLMIGVPFKTRDNLRLFPTDPVMVVLTTDPQGFDPGGQIVAWRGFTLFYERTPSR